MPKKQYFSADYRFDPYWIQRRVMGSKYNELTDQVRDQFPVRRRTTPVLCPITGEETINTDGISERAWQLIDKGLKLEEIEAEAAANREWYCVAPDWIRIQYPDVERMRDVSIMDMYEFAKTMFKNMEHYRKSYAQMVKEVNGSYQWNDNYKWLFRYKTEPTKEMKHSTRDVYFFLMTAEEAKIFEEFSERLLYTLNREIHGAMQTGTAWLTKMARSEMSIKDIDRLAGYLQESSENVDGN